MSRGGSREIKTIHGAQALLDAEGRGTDPVIFGREVGAPCGVIDHGAFD